MEPLACFSILREAHHIFHFPFLLHPKERVIYPDLWFFLAFVNKEVLQVGGWWYPYICFHSLWRVFVCTVILTFKQRLETFWNLSWTISSFDLPLNCFYIIGVVLASLHSPIFPLVTLGSKLFSSFYMGSSSFYNSKMYTFSRETVSVLSCFNYQMEKKDYLLKCWACWWLFGKARNKTSAILN